MHTGWALVCWAPHTFHFALLIFKPKQLFSELMGLPKALVVTSPWSQMSLLVSLLFADRPLDSWGEFSQ